MRIRSLAGLGLVTCAVPAIAQETVQVTNGDGKNSNVVHVGPKGTHFVAISSAGDLVPKSLTAPGNADGSTEAYVYDIRDGALTQITTYAGAAVLTSTPVSVLPDDAIFLRSTADLTPAAPGHPTTEVADYLYKAAPPKAAASLIQITPSTATGADLVLPFPYLRHGRSIVFSSSGDPIAGSNTDASTEVFVYDRDAAVLSQITAGGGDTYLYGPYDRDRRLVVQSNSDLAGAGANADASDEMFIETLSTRAFEQLTHEPAGVGWYPVFSLDAKGRFLVAQRRDATGAEVVTEYWVVDLQKRTFRPLTSAVNDGVNEVKGVLPGTSLLVLNSKADLVPQSLTAPGNADRSLEIFTVDTRTRAVAQRTAAAGDITLRQMPRSKSRPAVVTSKADLTPGAPGSAGGVQQVYLLPLGRKLSPPLQVTNADRDCTVSALDDAGDFVAITSKGDLVPASLSTPGNAAHVQQIFVLSLKGAPSIRQMTVADKDVTFKGFLHDGHSFLAQTKADLTPGRPGNPKGGTEIYRISYR